MIYVYAKYQKPTPYIKRDIANVKVFTTPAGRPAGRTDGRNRHYIDSHCIACESKRGTVNYKFTFRKKEIIFNSKELLYKYISH